MTTKTKTRTTATVSVKNLKKIIESGEFTGRKITNISFEYTSVMIDEGRGNATYDNVVSNVVIEFAG